MEINLPTVFSDRKWVWIRLRITLERLKDLVTASAGYFVPRGAKGERLHATLIHSRGHDQSDFASLATIFVIVRLSTSDRLRVPVAGVSRFCRLHTHDALEGTILPRATDLGCAKTNGHQFDRNRFGDTINLRAGVLLFRPFYTLHATVVDHLLEGSRTRGHSSSC